MNKILLFAAIAALFSFISCQKEETPTKEEAKDLIFTAIIDNSGTKTTVDAANAKVAWVSGDQVAISDNASHSATYQVSTIDAQGKATFTKVSGDVLTTAPFTATYGSSPSTSQIYSATAPALPMSATSSTTSLTFTVTCGLLEFNITQADESIKSISVSDNNTTPNTYTLNCGDGVSIGSGAKFYIAVPGGTYTTISYTNGTNVVRARTGLNISVQNNHIKPVSSNFAPKYSSGKTDIDYGINIAGKWWSPVNCGYSTTETNGTKGKIYQWGRFVGSYWGSSTQTSTSTSQATKIDNPADNVFYVNGETYDFYGDWRVTQLSSWPMKSDDDGYIAGKVDNPCPNGWRVPTVDELGALCYTDYNSGTRSGTIRRSGNVIEGGWEFTQEGGNSLQFVHSGSRAGAIDGIWSQENLAGTYFSSTTNDNYVYSLVVATSNERRAWIDPQSKRANGFSVRCVKE